MRRCHGVPPPSPRRRAAHARSPVFPCSVASTRYLKARRTLSSLSSSCLSTLSRAVSLIRSLSLSLSLSLFFASFFLLLLYIRSSIFSPRFLDLFRDSISREYTQARDLTHTHTQSSLFFSLSLSLSLSFSLLSLSLAGVSPRSFFGFTTGDYRRLPSLFLLDRG